MHASLDVILDTYVREGLVYYRALRSERGRLDGYISNLDVPVAALEGWSTPEQAAFWLNAYNAIRAAHRDQRLPDQGHVHRSIRPTASSTCPAPSSRSGIALAGGCCRSRTSRSRCCRRSTTRACSSRSAAGPLAADASAARPSRPGRLEQQLASVAAECVSRNECFQYDPAADRIEISPIFGWREAEFTRAWTGRSRDLRQAQPDRAGRLAHGDAARAAERGTCPQAQHVRAGLLRVRLASQRPDRRRAALTWISDSQARLPSSPAAARDSAWRRLAPSSPKARASPSAAARPPTLDQAARELAAVGGGTTDVLAVQADVSREADLQHLVDETVARFGGIDVLVNNVGLGKGGGLLDTPDDVWQQAFDQTLFPAIRASRLVVPHMRAARRRRHPAHCLDLGAGVRRPHDLQRGQGCRDQPWQGTRAAAGALQHPRQLDRARARSSSKVAPGTSGSRPTPMASRSSSRASCRSAGSGAPTKWATSWPSWLRPFELDQRRLRDRGRVPEPEQHLRERRTQNANAERRTPNAERRTPGSRYPVPGTRCPVPVPVPEPGSRFPLPVADSDADHSRRSDPACGRRAVRTVAPGAAVRHRPVPDGPVPTRAGAPVR